MAGALTGAAGTVTGAAGEAGRAAIGGAFAEDPKFFDKVIVDGLQKQGYSEVEAYQILNFIQGRSQSAEQGGREYGTGLGVGIEKDRLAFYKLFTEKYANLSEEQRRKAADALANLSQELNRQTLETERLKVATQLGPYETAGKFAGFVYAVGAIIESVSPGSGRQIMDQSKLMINEINANVRAIKLPEIDQAQFFKAYQGVVGKIVGLNLDVDELDKTVTTRYGDKKNPDGSIESATRLRRDAERLSNGHGDVPVDTKVRGDDPANPTRPDPTDVPASGPARTVSPQQQPVRPAAAADPTDVPASGPARNTPPVAAAAAPVARVSAAGAPDLEAILLQVMKQGKPDAQIKNLVTAADKADLDKNGSVDTEAERRAFENSNAFLYLPTESKAVVMRAVTGQDVAVPGQTPTQRYAPAPALEFGN